MIRATFLFSLACLPVACKGSNIDATPEAESAAEHAHTSYTCVHEANHLPPLDPEADRLYHYGRYLESKVPSRNVSIGQFNEIARYYRLAAAYGNYRANLALLNLMYQVSDDDYDNISTLWRKQRDSEAQRLLDQLVGDNIPAGFDREGNIASQDWNLPSALSLYRKAAELGNPHAQYAAKC
jgi:TPR repeat protein